MKKRVLIVCPHPDDGEAFASQLCVQALSAGWDVHQVLATCDEYGTPEKLFKGQRIQRIRRHEMQQAQQAYNPICDKQNELQLHWMNYIDGFVPHNRTAVKRLAEFIRKIHPDIIIGPDPFMYCDGHVDHLAVGKNYFFALKLLKSTERPKRMLFFQTLMPDYFLPRKYIPIVKNTREAHTSQWSGLMLGVIDWFNALTQLPYQLKHGRLHRIEGYRRVSFTQYANIPKGFAKIVFFLFRERPIGCESRRFIPGPNELDLNLHPTGDI